MPRLVNRAVCFVALLILVGCQSYGRKPVARAPSGSGPVARGPAAPMTKLEIADRGPPKNSATQPPASPVTPTAAVQEPAIPDRVTRGQGNDIVVRGTSPQASGDSPGGETKPVNGPARLRELHTQAASKYSQIQDYVCRLRRREVVGGKQMPEDLLTFKFKNAPTSIYMKWLEGTACEGREVILVKGKYNNQLQVKTGKKDIISGMRIELDPHSARATANSRRTIDEAGVGNLVERFGQVLAAQENGAKTYGPLQYIGLQQRPESPIPMECVAQQVPAGLEKYLPNGGTRYWFFNMDARTKEYGLPVLISTFDENRREVEYYLFDRMNTNVGLFDADFDPDTVYGKK